MEIACQAVKDNVYEGAEGGKEGRREGGGRRQQ